MLTCIILILILIILENFKVDTFLTICDSLIVEMKHRFKICESVHSIFAFLFDYNNTNLIKKRNQPNPQFAVMP